ncbi:hypothetical protein KAH94_04770 [bacterium]|nr:hypothetical protein [bacterium]
MKRLLIILMLLLSGTIAQSANNIQTRHWEKTYGQFFTVYVTEYLSNEKVISIRAFFENSNCSLIDSYSLLKDVETGEEKMSHKTAIDGQIARDLKFFEEDVSERRFSPWWWVHGYSDNYEMREDLKSSVVPSFQKRLLHKVIDDFLSKTQSFNRVESVPKRSWWFNK